MEPINLLKEYGVKSEAELFSAKTTQKQSRALITGKPKKVSLPIDQVKRLCTLAGLEYKAGYEGRILEYVTTNETIDRYGDIVRAKGLDFKSNYYPNNPVMMFSHQYQMLPIGNAIKIWYDNQNKCIPAYGLFMDDDVDKSGFSDLVFRIAQAGFMRACSIGFMPLEWNQPKTDEDREKLGLGKYGVEFLKGEYLEFSPCGIPANPQALCNYIENTPDLDMKSINQETLDKMEKVKMFDDLNILQIFKDVTAGNRLVSLDTQTQAAKNTVDFNIDLSVLKANPDEGGTFKYCVCKKCGYYEEHKAGNPCSEIKCPDCDETLTGSNEKPEKSKDENITFSVSEDGKFTFTVSASVDEYADFCTAHDCCCVEEIEKEVAIKPLPTEHACRLSEPDKYEKFRRGSRKSGDKVYSVIFGKNADTWEEQAYRYAKDVWTEDEAKKHCEEHNGIAFEAAAEKEESIDMGKVIDEINEIKIMINSLSQVVLDEISNLRSELNQLRSSFESAENDDDLYQDLNIDLEPKL